MTKLKALLAATALCTGMAAAPADAAQYLVTYSSMYTVFSGTLTTTDTADANGFFTITALDGTRNGGHVTLLPVGSVYSDNLFKPTNPFLFSGFTYESRGDWINVFNQADAVEECFAAPGDNDFCIVNSTTGFTVTRLTTPTPGVPEPATWALMMAGFGLLGASLRRRATVRIRFA